MVLPQIFTLDCEETSSLPSTKTGSNFDLDSDGELNFDLDQLFDLELYSDLRQVNEPSGETKAMIDPDDLSLTEYLLQFGKDGSEGDDSDCDSFPCTEQQASIPSPSPPPSVTSNVSTRSSLKTTVKQAKKKSPEVNTGGGNIVINRKAVMAKQNREKKKQHLSELEKTVEQLKKDKDNLQSNIEQLEETLEDMMTEIGYLKGVIANQSELSSLLKSIGTTPGVKFGSSSLLSESYGKQDDLTSNKRRLESDGKGDCVNGKKMKTGKESSVEAGVCLHVRNGKVSLEFCADCNQKANTAEAFADLNETH